MDAHPSSKKAFLASIVVAILGMIDTALLTAQHYRIANEGLMQKSFCTLSQLIDCDTALTSPYARTLNIPNSELGFLFYTLILVFCLWALSSQKWQKVISAFLLLAATLALGFAAYMGYRLTATLHVICLMCIISHALTLIIFICSWRACPIKIHRVIAFLIDKENLGKSIVLTCTWFAIFSLGILFFHGTNEKAHAPVLQFNKQQLIKHFYSQTPVEINVENRPTWGPDDAAITIVDFSDFQCPHCKRAAFSLKPYLGEYRDQIRIVYMNFPLDSLCNPNIKHSIHASACIAAKAALCVFTNKPEKFWDYHDLVFENQKKLSRSLLTQDLARKVGIESKEMSQCIASDAVNDMLAQDVAAGEKAKVSGTPAIYINGRYLRSWPIPEVLRTIIAEELARSGS
jgi:protein-disulfide isomerase/uncharacterized membrane protein